VSTSYEYVRHPRLDQLRSLRPIKLHDLRGVNSDNWIVRLNARIGLRITVIVGTMWCAYVFTILALISFPAAIRSHDKIIIVAWIAQTFLQLVLLPIIIVGQNIQATAADKRAEETYKDSEAVLKEAEEIQKHLLAQDQQISSILKQMQELMSERAQKPQ
jgi:type VI protein secretion system component VasK